jgi:uncharacterized protein (TIGR00266 family)
MANGFDYITHGSDLQLIEIVLKPGGSVRAEAGAMTFMEDGIEMETGTGGGVLRGLKRAVTGESFFITSFTNQTTSARKVGFAAPFPGKIVPVELGVLHDEFLCQKDAFLCSDTSIEIEVALTKRFGAGLLGGEGFILQRLKGFGLAFLHAGGTVVEKKLEPGEVIKVDTGCIVAFSSSVDYDIQFVGGFRNALFGGEGLFLAALKGPGVVYLQSLPFSRLADRMKVGLSKHAG